MATQPFGGRDEVVTCGYCRRSPFKGKVEHKVGCPHENEAARKDPMRVKLYERGYWQRYRLFGLCFNSHPSYKLGWETGNRDLEDERHEEELQNQPDIDWDKFEIVDEVDPEY